MATRTKGFFEKDHGNKVRSWKLSLSLLTTPLIMITAPQTLEQILRKQSAPR